MVINGPTSASGHKKWYATLSFFPKRTASDSAKLVIPQKLSGIICSHRTSEYLNTCESLLIKIQTNSNIAMDFNTMLCALGDLAYLFARKSPATDIGSVISKYIKWTVPKTLRSILSFPFALSLTPLYTQPSQNSMFINNFISKSRISSSQPRQSSNLHRKKQKNDRGKAHRIQQSRQTKRQEQVLSFCLWRANWNLNRTPRFAFFIFTKPIDIIFWMWYNQNMN